MAGTAQGGFVKAIQACLRGEEGVAIVEFAATLPVLLVIAVSIFDLGGAFNLKQKLDNAAREAARYGSKLPTTDLQDTTSAPAPNSVKAIRDFVVSYLNAANVNTCGLASAGGGTSSPALVWKFTGTCAGGGTLTLTIDRGNNPGATGATFGVETIYMLGTDVKIQYPYTWQFNRVFSLVAPGASYAGTSLVTTEAIVPNME